MYKKILTYAIACSFCACGFAMIVDHEPVALKAVAKSIATSETAPYDCKALGNIEGNDTITLSGGASQYFERGRISELKTRAINDLKNNALDVIGKNASNKRIVLSITSEQTFCSPESIACVPNSTKAYS
ncbi:MULTISPECIES: hypothetical protein [unclassified Campylobacter]|uniref:hypothetical protein n=1 Tax=unclassified Campylobacter TaxID=2593542 RepID=UPI001237CADD|nr:MULTISPECIES: hypothetical protein [unclassified Campylobacter]KAA6225460.1 hypothetical protein FMM55_06555 [Campylobacter sp. LR196d]KAA6227398.1 hypothetical protein FMM54_02700 [Campylobacter sp. LR185c]KAA6229949.1 hypothetical protein FMM57_00225 [Campylobacter sp. LR286c]KAA6234474.1 hypothetical protein FMM56_00210 [Campylobacter sp. LR264d]KAA8604134.1 hypothetical protein CGP82_04260 [Campylobacter sp. LR185c]